MPQRPPLNTERLTLRPFTLADAPEVQRLAGDQAIASTTCNLPHPYEDGIAEQWIGTHQEQFDKGQGLDLAITHSQQHYLIGSIGLRIDSQHQRAELGYWIGKDHWSNGYCTEAAQAMLNYAFTQLKLNRIIAHHLLRNPASGRVMQKIGMRREGHFPQHIKKNDKFEDIIAYGILNDEYKPN